MNLDKSKQYVFRIGSDNQHRFYWSKDRWTYEFLAGGVLFDEQTAHDEAELEQAVAVHGMTLGQFQVDNTNAAERYSQSTRDRIEKLRLAGVTPCPKHGMMVKNESGDCVACQDPDYFDDFKGTEG